MFRKADLGQIILANTFYDVLYTAEVPDGEGAPSWTMKGVRESSDKHRKENVTKIVKITLLPSDTPNRLKLTYCTQS